MSTGPTSDLPMTLPLDRIALFLDLDGTLAPFTDVPQGVGPDSQRNGLLHQLARRLHGRLAVISGRSISDLDRILDNQVLCLAGSHGLQRRDARGHVMAVPPHPGVRVATAAFEDFAQTRPGVLVEHKPLSVALHYRNAPQAEADVQALAMELARATGLKLQFGTCVAELVTLGADKGQALAAFMDEAPFSGFQPVFVGDDLTDEDGFRAAVDLGGYGILVGPPRPSRAQYRLESSVAVIEWLQDLLLTENLLLEYKL
ncbi:trehalose-phosphatase [Asticcacaulis sp. EMRT-3]|uniref:trehalose-phosphatase n=1 Tax=Asticcacaulis sp. EMRT-3 TaxID=3040349 RepID=UPI0024AEBB0A|nr:trehalose-phosphatase [Asticcacaulis sp. EMRT-3]MDI7775301.1 trehalose-phosphatase [Asticcacaulis sp. EMRT-3]